MKKAADSILREKQADIRQDRSCTDNIATLRMRNTIEQSVERNFSQHVSIFDYERTFDRVDMEPLWKLLGHDGIPKFISLMQCSCQGMSCRAAYGGQLSSHISVQTGVRQGCLM